MIITDLLENNARQFPDDVALVEINPTEKETRRMTWRDYELVEPTPRAPYYRREITWRVFDEKANRFANALSARGIGKGDKVAVLLMNCIEWLPIYFGILKTGALAVPLNYRYAASEITYCLNLAEADALVFGAEFIGRVEEIADKISEHRLLIYQGTGCPSFAEDYAEMTAECSGVYRMPHITEDDDAAIYFSSGTTGFPKAILHTHRALIHACRVEQNHHSQTRDDVFLCIPPLYHTGAKMHWFGSLASCSYIPLGGNRKGLPRQFFNIAVVWFVTGFWHGASWNYILWGVYFGVILIVEKLFLLKWLKNAPKVLSHLYAIVLILVGWLIFAFPDMNEGMSVLKAMFGVGVDSFATSGIVYDMLRYLPLMLICIVGATPLPKKIYKGLTEKYAIARYLVPVGVAASILICTAYMVDSSFSPFLYFIF